MVTARACGHHTPARGTRQRHARPECQHRCGHSFPVCHAPHPLWALGAESHTTATQTTSQIRAGSTERSARRWRAERQARAPGSQTHAPIFPCSGEANGL